MQSTMNNHRSLMRAALEKHGLADHNPCERGSIKRCDKSDDFRTFLRDMHGGTREVSGLELYTVAQEFTSRQRLASELYKSMREVCVAKRVEPGAVFKTLDWDDIHALPATSTPTDQ